MSPANNKTNDVILSGQWLGTYNGSNSGSVILNIDDCGDFYSGVAFMIDDVKGLPITVGFIPRIEKGDAFETEIHPSTFNGATRQFCS